MSDEIRPFPPYAPEPEPEHRADEISGGGGSTARRAGAVAAGVALALGAGGVAYAAGTSGATPSRADYGLSGYGQPGYGAPGVPVVPGVPGDGDGDGDGDRGHGPGGGHGREGLAGFAGPVLHGQATVRDGAADSTATKEVFVQRGDITDVTATSLTVKSTDGFSRTYVLNAQTTVRTPDALAAGDTVGVTADLTGTTATATVVVERGAMPDRPKGDRALPVPPSGAAPSTPTPSESAPSESAPAAPSGTGAAGSGTAGSGTAGSGTSGTGTAT